MIAGIQKTTLVDYPGKVACTIFLSGCNFRCGYCHNKDLVLSRIGEGTISEEEVMAFLEKRKHVLDGVCITGGEPTLYPGLKGLCKSIKDLGLLVKLDTNGTNPLLLDQLIKEQLVDYIAMDIKASWEGYDQVTYVKTPIQLIRKSIHLLVDSGIEYEFRSTVVPDVMTGAEIENMGIMVKGAKKFYLQQFRQNENTLDKKYHSMDPLGTEVLEGFKDILQHYVGEVGLRSV